MKRPIFFASFFSTKLRGSKFLTSAAIWQANWATSNCVIFVTPLFPAMSAGHASSTVLPTAQIRPIPVMTTRRCKLFAAFRVFGDVIDGVLDGANLLGVFVGNLEIEGFFEGHHEFNCVEGIGAEIIDERC